MKVVVFNKKSLIIIIIAFILIFLFLLFCSNYFSIATAVPAYSYAGDSMDSSSNNDLQEKLSSLAKSSEKIAYLTFDDGPTIKATPKVLDVLKEENVKASFFVIGKYVSHHPELVKRAYEEGHYIANHGYDHNNEKLYKNDKSFINEIESTDKEIGKAIGISDYHSYIFRFPNGYMSPNNKLKKKHSAKLLAKMNYGYIDWNCLNSDSVKKYTTSQLVSNLKKSCKNKGTLVILMHDTTDVSNSSLALKESIDYLKEQGYEFRNFYDLF